MTEQNGASGEIQLVVFDLAAEFYGVDIGDVREIIRMQAITRVPGTSSYVEGVINLRGKVVPVVDLRKRLNRQVSEQTKESRIVVVDMEGKDVGVIVDGVTEVLRIPIASVEPPSRIVASTTATYLRGIAKLADKLVILLDLDRVLVESDLSGAISPVGAAPEPEGTRETAKNKEGTSQNRKALAQAA